MDDKNTTRPKIARLAAQFPEDATHVVVAKFGVQSFSPELNKQKIKEMAEFFTGEFAPKSLERMAFIDTYGYINEILMGYWLDTKVFENWFAREDVASWWNNLPIDPDSDLGFWKEVIYTAKDRFQHSTKPDSNLVGIGKVLPLVTSKNYVNSSLYRSRFPAAAYDDFECESQELPVPVAKDTKGKRLSVSYPTNLCYLREGEDRSSCTDEENALIEENIRPNLEGWIASLRAKARENGCLVIEDYKEVDLETRKPLNMRSFGVFMSSLKHIEHAARTYLVHLNLIKQFVELKKQEKIPHYLVWVEAHIIKHGELHTEYVNCHPFTGLLPYFETELIE